MFDRSRRPAFTLVELLVVIAIIGVLVALLLPAVQASREAARATRCKDNLRQIALSVIHFHDAHEVLPPGRIAPRFFDPLPFACGGKEPSWIVHVLPYLEAAPLRDKWDVLVPYNDHAEETRKTRLAVFICTSRRTLGQAHSETVTKVLPPVVSQCGCQWPGGVLTSYSGSLGDYAGNLGEPSPGANGLDTDFILGGNGTGVLIASRPICRLGKPTDWIDKLTLASLADGTSNTLLVGELFVPQGLIGVFPDDSPMYNGEFFSGMLRVTGVGIPLARGPIDPEGTRFSFGSWHPNVCHFSMADGSVRPLNVTTSSAVLAALAHREDGSARESGQ